MTDQQNRTEGAAERWVTPGPVAHEPNVMKPLMAAGKKKPLTRRLLRFLRGVILYLAFVALLVWGLPIGLSQWLGTKYPMAAITSGSMWPALKVGDLILVQHVKPEQLNVGDIVVYANVRGFTIHRITAIDQAKGEITTKGDANNVSDPAVPMTDVIGKTLQWPSGKPVRMPRLGFVSIMVSQQRGPE